MKPATTEDVFELLDGCFFSAALGAAMELGLFRLLERGPLPASGIAAELQIPPGRCGYWLQLLEQTGLLAHADGMFALSDTARSAVLDGASHELWSFLARELRDRMPLTRNLPNDLGLPGSVWGAHGLEAPDYFVLLRESPERAREFTRALYEAHTPLAAELADALDLAGVQRVLDLGGGSGVVSEALLRRRESLRADVIDIPNVCAAGRELALESGLADRLTFLEADYLKDELPSGFDLTLLCDAGGYGEPQLRRVLATLRPGGRLVLVDQFSPAKGVAPPEYVLWAFLGSLAREGAGFPTAAAILARLEGAGFEIVRTLALGAGRPDTLRFSRGWTMIEARRPAG